MTIFITGIRGFLGSHLAREFESRGHSVAGRPDMRLGEPFDAGVFAGAALVIHCAHDFTAGAGAKNIAGTQRWLKAAAACGVSHQIYMSSYSAGPAAPSEYGRTKYTLERMFLDAGHTVLRPGLVIGEGGLFARQRAALLRTPVIPLIGGGNQPVALIAADHFTAATARIAEEGRVGAFNLFYEPMPTAREFVRALRHRTGRGAIFIPVPAGLAVGLARLARMLRLPIPVDPDQIRSLAANSSAPWKSDLVQLLPERQAEFTLRF